MPRDQRVCEWCGLGLVEDERHFVDVCDRWASERRGVWDSMARADGRTVRLVAGWPSHARLDWLLAGGSARTRMVVVRRMGSWLAKRERLGGGQEGSRGWGEKLTAEGQRSLEGRQVEKIRGMRGAVAKEAQAVWLRMGKERRDFMARSRRAEEVHLERTTSQERKEASESAAAAAAAAAMDCIAGI